MRRCRLQKFCSYIGNSKLPLSLLQQADGRIREGENDEGRPTDNGGRSLDFQSRPQATKIKGGKIMTDTTNAHDRAELEKSLADIRKQIAKAREGLARLSSDQRHLFRKECVLLGCLDRPGEDIENISQQLIETRSELDAYRTKIDAVETELETLTDAALGHIEASEVHRRLPGIIRDLTVVWACHAQRGRFAPSLPSYAADLLRDRLQDAGEKYMSGEADLDACATRLKRKYRI
jgi:septal ring factor EnvC (AmiA/AmiB activator)